VFVPVGEVRAIPPWLPRFLRGAPKLLRIKFALSISIPSFLGSDLKRFVVGLHALPRTGHTPVLRLIFVSSLRGSDLKIVW